MESASITSALYNRHAEWWPLLSAPEEYEEDAAAYTGLIRSACATLPATLLELGSGGGNNACFMKKHFSLTLTDVSSAMLDVSKRLNPECEHIRGDMRTLRLGRVFDAVFVHDAIGYMTTLDDLRRAMRTAFVHCREGGCALFAPDYTRETFRDGAYHGGHDGTKRSMRYLQWDHDPDPDDSVYNVDFAFMFRDAGHNVRMEHETHVCGLFAIEEWYVALRETGFGPESATLESDQIEPGFYRVFIGRKSSQTDLKSTFGGVRV